MSCLPRWWLLWRGAVQSDTAAEQADEAVDRPRFGPTGHGGGALRVLALRRAPGARSLSTVFDGPCRMNRRSVTAIVIGAALVLTLGAHMAQAKRGAPGEVRSVVSDGVRYVVIHFGFEHGKAQNGGYVQARRVGSDELLWDRMVYSVAYDEKLERDVQDVFITRVAVKGRALVVENELGERFEMDLDSGRCRAVVKKSRRTAAVTGRER